MRGSLFFLGLLHRYRAGSRVQRDTAPIVRCMHAVVWRNMSLPSSRPHHHHQSSFVQTGSTCPRATRRNGRLRSAMADCAGGARRRERRLRSWAKHERLSVAMALVEASHHSAPRRPKTARAEEGGGFTSCTTACGHRSDLHRGSGRPSLRSLSRSGATAACGAPQRTACRPSPSPLWQSSLLPHCCGAAGRR